jgi:hypothetical protein
LRHGTASLGGSVSHGKKSYVQVVGRNGLSELGEVLDLASASLGTQLALYGSIMAGIRDRLTSDLGLDEVLVSENSSLPFSLAS